MHPKWLDKFELKPGKWVFVPSAEAKKVGYKIKADVEKHWTAPDNFYHLRAGGHVEALKAHVHHTSFLHLDIRDFFGSVNRSRVTRCLTPFFGYAVARSMSNDSTVQHPTIKGRYMVPYGFVQSPLLASLALADSALGARLAKFDVHADFAVSVYVDDIIVSADDANALQACAGELAAAAEKSRFELNGDKQEGPAPTIRAFNVELAHGNLTMTQKRFDEMKAVLLEPTSTQSKKDGIRGYVRTINAAQAKELA